MKREDLYQAMLNKKSCLCVGLDTDIEHPNFPQKLLSTEDPIFEFNKAIIDATHDLCIAYKPNFAFYEAHGSKGYKSLEKTMDYMNQKCPEIFSVADAKRGDIDNTSRMYAKSIFENMNFDSVTLSPYMGSNTVEPFLEYDNKWVILLGLTSNKSHKDFQLEKNENGEIYYQTIIKKAKEWGSAENTMFVVGATNPTYFEDIRKQAPDNFFLVPGVGAQGGSASEVMKHAKNDKIGLLINSSRGITLAAKQTEDFAAVARQKCITFNEEIQEFFL